MYPGVEKRNNILIGLQESSQVCTLVLITMRTSISKVGFFIAATILGDACTRAPLCLLFGLLA